MLPHSTTPRLLDAVSRIARKGLTGGCLALAFACLGVSAVAAHPAAPNAPQHGEYQSSDPAANAVLQQAPSTVHITFVEEIIPAQSDVTIYDFDGKQVSVAGSMQADANNLKNVSVQMQGDGSEGYVVVWRNVSAPDNHHDSGSFRFLVNPSSMLKQMTKAESKGGSNGSGSMPGMGSGMGGSDSGSSGIPPFAATLIGLLGLVIGGAAGVVFARRVNAPPTA